MAHFKRVQVWKLNFASFHISLGILQGYWKKKCRLFEDIITEDVRKKIDDIENLLQEDSITEVYFTFQCYMYNFITCITSSQKFA